MQRVEFFISSTLYTLHSALQMVILINLGELEYLKSHSN
jgi:hypothetical protein